MIIIGRGCYSQFTPYIIYRVFIPAGNKEYFSMFGFPECISQWSTAPCNNFNGIANVLLQNLHKKSICMCRLTLTCICF